MTDDPKPPAPYETWAELLLNRSPVSSHEWARVEDGISYAKQFELARAELAALRERVKRLEGALHKYRSSHSDTRMRELIDGRFANITEPCDCYLCELARAALEEKP